VFRFPNSMSTEGFLDRCWQKALLMMPQAMPGELPKLSPDELAWLATLDDVESRLVFTEKLDNHTRYRVEHGPFDNRRLGALPHDKWTLLVQDVEKHLPDFRKYCDEVAFIPDWRIDDVMVSLAAPGGSVGPHRDNYDVFLCQGTGKREWRIAAATAALNSIESGDLALLEPFTDASPITAVERDVLYLPPGVAHWGVAMDECITYSIGMRAPTESDLRAAVARRLGIEDTDDQKDDDVFYTDADLAIEEAEAGLISERALERARASFAVASDLDPQDLAMSFGILVSDVKAWLRPEAADSSEFDPAAYCPSSGLRVHGMARLAHCAAGNQDLVFVNGFGRSVSASQMPLFRRLCSDRSLDAAILQCELGCEQGRELIGWLAANGAFDLLTEKQEDAE
jgi:50S ribosomal protein L16 3-hydroxylase